MRFDLSTSGHRKEVITLAEGSFSVLVRNPTFAELIQDAATTENYLEARVRSSIVGWEGVEDAEGKPIPFTWDALRKLCEIERSVFWDLLRISRENFNQARATRKNLPDASVDLSAGAILKSGGLSGMPISASVALPGSPVPLESVPNDS